MSYKHFTMATIVLFFASKQIHCAPVIFDCMSDWSFTQRVLNIHQSGYSAAELSFKSAKISVRTGQRNSFPDTLGTLRVVRPFVFVSA